LKNLEETEELKNTAGGFINIIIILDFVPFLNLDYASTNQTVP
jgi:hypothetical protein